MRRNEIIVLCVAVSALVIALIRLTLLDVINTAQGIEIMITFVLVLVTVTYVRRTEEIADTAREQAEATRQQADATVNMAEEMANTRYDAFRPIIDIVEMPMEATEILKHGFEAKEGKFPENLPCELHNIGVGPAIGVSSFITVPSNGERQPQDFGTIAGGHRTSEFRLSPQQIDDRMFLAVYYKDIYGRDIESRREVTLDKEGPSWKIHPLETQVREISKEGEQQ